jgi:hypothetical protein
MEHRVGHKFADEQHDHVAYVGIDIGDTLRSEAARPPDAVGNRFERNAVNRCLLFEVNDFGQTYSYPFARLS